MNLFASWFTEAEATPTIEEANAMSLVTQGLDGYPKARVVLLKHYDSKALSSTPTMRVKKAKRLPPILA